MVKILTEASIKKGYGHIYRCMTIAEEMDSYIYVDTSNEELSGNLKHLEHVPWQNIEWINNNINHSDIVIVDSYHIDYKILERIDYIAKTLLIIDDLIRLEYRNKLILNPNNFGNDLPYHESNTVLCGENFLLTRKEFDNCNRESVNETVQNIFMIFGATDMNNITDLVLNFINSNRRFERTTVHLITRDGLKYNLGHNVKLYSNLTGKEICQLMMKCDFAITAGGSTVNELIKTQTPFACVKVADNQVYNIKSIVRKGYGIEFCLSNLSVLDEMFDLQKRLIMFNNLKKNQFKYNGAHYLKKYLEGQNE